MLVLVKGRGGKLAIREQQSANGQLGFFKRPPGWRLPLRPMLQSPIPALTAQKLDAIAGICATQHHVPQLGRNSPAIRGDWIFLFVEAM